MTVDNEDRVRWFPLVMCVLLFGMGVGVIVMSFLDGRAWVPFAVVPLGVAIMLIALALLGDALPKTDRQIEAEVRARYNAHALYREEQQQSRRRQIAERVVREQDALRGP